MDYKEKLLNSVPLKILSFLCRVPHTAHYGREIARSTGVSIGSANQTLNLLLNMGVAAREKKGQRVPEGANIKPPWEFLFLGRISTLGNLLFLYGESLKVLV